MISRWQVDDQVSDVLAAIASGRRTEPRGDVRHGNPQTSKKACSVLETSENVSGCLEAAILKLNANPGWSFVDTAFTHRMLPAVIDATKNQLLAADQRRQELLAESENLRVFVGEKEEELAELKHLMAEQAWFPRKESYKAEMRLKQARERNSLLQSKMQIASAELQHLQDTVGEALTSERESWQRRKADLQTEQDTKAQEVSGKKEQLRIDVAYLRELKLKVASAAQNMSQSQFEAALLPETEKKLRELQLVWGELQMQLNEMNTKKGRKKGKKR